MYCTLCRNNDPIIELLRVISHGGNNALKNYSLTQKKSMNKLICFVLKTGLFAKRRAFISIFVGVFSFKYFS